MTTYKDFFEELHFFDCYFNELKVKNNLLTIACVNVGVSEHPVNRASKMKYIDFSYIVFENVFKVSSGLEEFDVVDWSFSKRFNEYYFGGLFLKKKEHVEIKIMAESARLIVPEDFKLACNMWIPVDTPSYKQNMSKELVDSFFS